MPALPRHALNMSHWLPHPYEKSKIPFSYMLYAYSVKEPIGELNLKRAFG